MTPNDAEIDVLMRRFAGHARGDAAPEHLDADELNAFAEGLLPPAARARYVSHLADCGNCRKLASQLALSAGAVAKAEPIGSTEAGGASWSQRLAALFAPRTLRYAAFAVLLIAAAGVVFLVARRPSSDTGLVARNEQGNQSATTAGKPADQVASQTNLGDSMRPDANQSGKTESAQTSKPTEERDESEVAKTTTPPLKPAETSATTSPLLAAEKRAEPAIAKAQPSYAPPPPGEGQGVDSRSREQQNVGGLVAGPRKSDSPVDKSKAMDKAAETTARERQTANETNRVASNQAPQSRTTQEKRSGPSRNMDQIVTTGRNQQELRVEAPKKDSGSTTLKSEPAPETRSVGGRKFQRQGNAWVDLKFKSSMSVRNVSRGSEEFTELDSGLRSIAQQLGGEIIVVWKSKAYRIR